MLPPCTCCWAACALCTGGSQAGLRFNLVVSTAALLTISGCTTSSRISSLLQAGRQSHIRRQHIHSLLQPYLDFLGSTAQLAQHFTAI